MVIGDMLSELGRLEERIAQNEKTIVQLARNDEQAKCLLATARGWTNHCNSDCGEHR